MGCGMITNSGRHIQIIVKRYCPKCNVLGDQVCHKVRYQENTEQAGTLLKKSYWVCPTCHTEKEDVKVQPLPGDKVKIINRLLRMQEDYAIRSMNIASQPEKLVIEITIKE
jgi:rubredoxin